MRLLHIIIVICFFLNIGFVKSQTIIWTEDFGTGCNQGLLANGLTTTNGTWNVSATGANAAEANEWFISATEAGMGDGNCGDGCLSNGALTNRSLHLGNVAIPIFGLVADNGAAYNAGGLCPSWFCVATDKRAESPVIDLTGQSNITLDFKYMEFGDGAFDNASLWYYDGATWSQLIDLAKTQTTCSPQGIWTAYSQLLPASADNNPNVRIGFRWVNNDDGAGSDPSFAVDDITLSVSAPLPVEMSLFEVNPVGNKVLIKWETESELNNDYFTIERSKDGKRFHELADVKGAGTINQQQSYTFLDKNPLAGISYYRIRQTDFNGENTTSQILSAQLESKDEIFISPNLLEAKSAFQINLPFIGEETQIVVINQLGVKVLDEKFGNENHLTMTAPSSSGIYIVQVNIDGVLYGTQKIVVR